MDHERDLLEETHLSLQVVLMPLGKVTKVLPVHLEDPSEVSVGHVVLEVRFV